MKDEEISDTDGQNPKAGTIGTMAIGAAAAPPLICGAASSVFRGARASAVIRESREAALEGFPSTPVLLWLRDPINYRVFSSQRCGWSRSGACGGEEASDHPHVHGEQGELFRQEEHSPFQVSQETRGVRPRRRPVRYLGILEERLHNPEQVEGVVILGQRKLVDGRTLRVL